MTRIAVLDYGSGNIRSVVRAAERTGAEVVLTADAQVIDAADGLIVPGVGAFAAVMRGIDSVGGVELIRARHRDGRPTLGVCVGLQVFFSQGIERGESSRGIGLWEGAVHRLDAPIVPHMGWANVAPGPDTSLFRGIESERFYFVHSYAATADVAGASVAHTTHGNTTFVSAVEDGATSATQFHPEKSGEAGRRLLGNWVASVERITT